mgnify:CR=1 FL=1|jgi:peptide-methionine (S)-S-oxide reductase
MKLSLSNVLLLVGLAFVAVGCDAGQSIDGVDITNKKDLSGYERAYFASGCFWCVEAIYEHIEGVEEVYNGYAGGHTDNPTYEASNTGITGHAESVEIYYDPEVVSFKELVDVYFGTQNIEQVNGQGNDIGSQYRSIAFYQNDQERKIIEAKIKVLEDQGYKVASEVKAFDKFWMGEDYHQDYERKHPDHPYIKAVSVPRLKRFKKDFPELVKNDK